MVFKKVCFTQQPNCTIFRFTFIDTTAGKALKCKFDTFLLINHLTIIVDIDLRTLVHFNILCCVISKTRVVKNSTSLFH